MATEIQTDFNPDNTNLLKKIKYFQNNQNQDSFLAVIEELKGNNAFLLVPVANPVTGKNPEKGWTTIDKGAKISFTSVFEVEEKLVIGVFTSQNSLLSWASETKPFITLPAKEVLEIAVEHKISKIIIDSNQEYMFVLGRTV